MKKIDINDLGVGASTRYLRDIYVLSDEKNISFEDFKKQWEIDYDNSCKERNKNHPVEFDKTVSLSATYSVRFFKRKGEDWMCSEYDMAPNGGSGGISLEDALKKCKIKNITEI